MDPFVTGLPDAKNVIFVHKQPLKDFKNWNVMKKVKFETFIQYLKYVNQFDYINNEVIKVIFLK